MPNWPAVKLLDMVVGIDIHAVVGVPVTPYFGPIFLWHSPKFPKADVLINGMPACSVGAMGYSVHIPQGIPVPPTPTNVAYWKRYLTNVAMGLVLMGLTTLANIAIAGIATADKIAGVAKLDFTLTEGTPNTRAWDASDLTSEASVTSAGNIQLDTTDTTGEVLLVLWLDITE